ncbi:MAG TPA: POTRA domain-containing protein, partial [Myxococcota bacterium]|nr:POTRA domain-containing protein [Myxococcota bacterium]
MCALLLAACSPARREVESDIVRRVRFEGNGGWFSDHNDLQLRAPMVQRQSPLFTFTFPFMYFTQPAPLDRAALDADARRIQVWYAHHGWFDAQFVGWEVRRVRARSDARAGVVDLIGHVAPGDASVVRTLDVQTAGEDKATRTVVRATLANGPVQEGDTFNLEYAQKLRQELQDAFQDHGEAYAKVDVAIHAWPEDGAVDLTYTIDPGAKARFGEVEITGLRTVETEVVLDSLTFAPHDPGRADDRPDVFSLRELRATQERLYETGLFSLVNVEPVLDDPGQPQVPVRIELHEAKFRRFRIGGGVAFDYFTLRPQISAELHDTRLGGSKLQLDLAASGGA